MATSADVNAFRAQFIELASATDPQIAAALNTTDVMLGSGVNWPNQNDFAMARKQYTAHLVVMQMMQMANASDGTGMADMMVTSIKFGERTISFGQRGSATKMQENDPADAMLFQTQQGQLFMQLRDRNIIGVMLI
jgi:hypothetical protein